MRYHKEMENQPPYQDMGTSQHLGASQLPSRPGNFAGAPLASTPFHQSQVPSRLLFPFSPVGQPPRMELGSSSVQQQLQQQRRQMQPVSPVAVAEIHFSGHHDGCYLYYSRLVRPLWTLNLVSTISAPRDGAPEVLVSTVSGHDLSNYLQWLTAFRRFLERTRELGGLERSGDLFRTSSTSGAEASRLQEQRKAHLEACARERASRSNLLSLVCHTVEVLSLWKVLCDHQFRTVASALAPEYREQLRGRATLRDLLVADRGLTSALAGSLVQSYLEDSATTEAVSRRLREVCPSLYRAEDALFVRAHELLLAAKGERNVAEKHRLLKEALTLCKQASFGTFG